MKKTHKINNLSGLNPRTARKLFQKLAQEYDGVSWSGFRKHAGHELRCFDDDSRWISGDLLRGYFAEFVNSAALSARMMKLYDQKAHRPSFSAYEEAA